MNISQKSAKSKIISEEVGKMSINPDRIVAARKKVEEDQYDVDSWLLLLKHAQCRGIDEARLET